LKNFLFSTQLCANQLLQSRAESGRAKAEEDEVDGFANNHKKVGKSPLNALVRSPNRIGKPTTVMCGSLEPIVPTKTCTNADGAYATNGMECCDLLVTWVSVKPVTMAV